MRPAAMKMGDNDYFTTVRLLQNSSNSIKAEYINPFIESVKNLFETMLNCQVVREDIALTTRIPPTLDIVALIGLSGCIRGNVAMAFPVKTALAMVSRAYRSQIVVVDSMVIDAVAEFVNIVAGGAQASLNQDVKVPVDLTIPTVIRGNRFQMEYPSMAAWIEVPFSSELGPFTIRISIHKKDNN
ncbi:MAG: chemotaxis protein CheX [Candidatus Omnitrophota bacterium]